MTDGTKCRIDAWLARCDDPANDPFQGMAEAGLFAPLESYAAIARTKAALTERTGLIGVGGAWGGRQMVGRYFIAPYATDSQRAAWLGHAASVAISEASETRSAQLPVAAASFSARAAAASSSGAT